MSRPRDGAVISGPPRTLDEEALRSEQLELRRAQPRTVFRAARLRQIASQLQAIEHRSPYR